MTLDRGKNLDWYDDDPEELDEMFWDGTWEDCYPELVNLDDIEEAYAEENDIEEESDDY
jgi:hypothetical protein